MPLISTRLVPACFLSSALFLAGIGPVLAGPYADSAHGNAISGVSRASIEPRYANFAVGNCAHCHEAHASLGGSEPLPITPPGPNPSLVFSPEQDLCETCHDSNGPASKDVMTQFAKRYGHPLAPPASAYAFLHTLSLSEVGQSGQPFRGLKRHVECPDCHEVHIAKSGSHTAPTNARSNVLLGVWGVEPVFGGPWTVPANGSYTEQKPAAKEYQICLKCHSDYAFNNGTGSYPVSDDPSGLTSVTDQAREFNPNNLSFHPVVQKVTKALDQSRLLPPWQTNAGNQTMYCSDCHGDEAAVTPQGPHGSAAKYLLKGGGTWPAGPNGSGAVVAGDGRLWTLGDVGAHRAEIQCGLCHTLSLAGLPNGNDVHNRAAHLTKACVDCHTAVPHGANHARLVAYATDPAPYNYNGAGTITSFTFQAGGAYGKANCTTSCHL